MPELLMLVARQAEVAIVLAIVLLLTLLVEVDLIVTEAGVVRVLSPSSLVCCPVGWDWLSLSRHAVLDLVFSLSVDVDQIAPRAGRGC